jgi:hypothetical protein
MSLTREQLKNQYFPQSTKSQPTPCTKQTLLIEILYIQQKYFFVNSTSVGSTDLGRNSHQYTFLYSENSTFIVENLSLNKVFHLKYFPRNNLRDIKVCHFTAEL